MRSKEFRIGGRAYTTTKFSVEQALDIEHKIGPAVLGAVSRAVGAWGGIDNIDGEALAGAFEGFFKEVIAAGGVALYKQILKATLVVIEPDSGQPEQVPCSDLNVAFDGHLADLKIVLFEVLKFNFQDYFTDASGRLRQLELKGRAQIDALLKAPGKKSES